MMLSTQKVRLVVGLVVLIPLLLLPHAAEATSWSKVGRSIVDDAGPGRLGRTHEEKPAPASINVGSLKSADLTNGRVRHLKSSKSFADPTCRGQLGVCNSNNLAVSRSLDLGRFSCNGNSETCTNIDINVGDYACNGDKACTSEAAGAGFEIKGGASNVCNGYYACSDNENDLELTGLQCNGYESCSGNKKLVLGDFSCTGYTACSFNPDADVTVGIRSCKSGDSNCANNSGGNVDVGDYSCDGYACCYNNEGGPVEVGTNACHGYYACANTDDGDLKVGDRSCHGDEACYDNFSLDVDDDACLGDDVCHNNVEGPVAVEPFSCIGDGCCRAVKGVGWCVEASCSWSKAKP